MREWKWDDPETESDVVVPAVQAVAVYLNPQGSVVIRQQDGMGGEDSVIVVPRSQAAALAKAIKQATAKPF